MLVCTSGGKIPCWHPGLSVYAPLGNRLIFSVWILQITAKTMVWEGAVLVKEQLQFSHLKAVTGSWRNCSFLGGPSTSSIPPVPSSAHTAAPLAGALPRVFYCCWFCRQYVHAIDWLWFRLINAGVSPMVMSCLAGTWRPASGISKAVSCYTSGRRTRIHCGYEMIETGTYISSCGLSYPLSPGVLKKKLGNMMMHYSKASFCIKRNTLTKISLKTRMVGSVRISGPLCHRESSKP